MLRLKELTLVESRDGLRAIPDGKVLINTINAHSYNVAQKDTLFADALRGGDYLIPDGASVVKACRLLTQPGLFLSCRLSRCTTRGLPSPRGARTGAGRRASPHSFSVGPSPVSARPAQLAL